MLLLSYLTDIIRVAELVMLAMWAWTGQCFFWWGGRILSRKKGKFSL